MPTRKASPYSSPARIARVVLLRQQGKTFRDISGVVKKPPSTCFRIVQAFKKTGDYYTKQSKPGRPPRLGPYEVRMAARMLAKCEAKTAADVQRSFLPHVSVETIRRHLSDYGLKAYRRRTKPLLTAAQVKKRRLWAKEHEKWEVKDWEQVLYSDESKFNLVGSDGVQWCYRRPWEAYDPRFVKKVVKHGGGSVMVWGMITPEGVGRLHRIDGTMDAVMYTEILSKSLLGTLKDRKIKKKDILFQQDNDPDRKSTRLNSSHSGESRMPSSA